MRFVVARNARTTLYEVHVAGCAHMMSRHLTVMGERNGTTGAEVAENFERENEDCFTKLGPCARKVAR